MPTKRLLISQSFQGDHLEGRSGIRQGSHAFYKGKSMEAIMTLSWTVFTLGLRHSLGQVHQGSVLMGGRRAYRQVGHPRIDQVEVHDIVSESRWHIRRGRASRVLFLLLNVTQPPWTPFHGQWEKLRRTVAIWFLKLWNQDFLRQHVCISTEFGNM